MLSIDGSLGEGGGQILRSSLALSMVTARPFRIWNLRANRAKPGLQRQHLTAVLSAAKICGAETRGAALGSRELWFEPGAVTPGEYHFAIGTAGSTTLVLQTVLPPLLLASGPSSIVIEGGTHNPHAPPVDFLAKTFLPLIGRMGPRVSLALKRYGFYPAGGGRISVDVHPVNRLDRMMLEGSGPPRRFHARAFVARLPRDIAERELAVVARELHWPPDALEVDEHDESEGPGNFLTLSIESPEVTEVITGFGERRVRAEEVAEGAVRQAREYLGRGAPVGEHLADQLLLPMAMAGGGAFVTGPLSLHATTNMDVIKMFLSVEFEVSRLEENRWRVEVRGL